MLRCATCQIGLEGSWTHLEGSWKLVDHTGNMGWKVHEIALNLHEIDSTLLGIRLTKGVSYSFPFMTLLNTQSDMAYLLNYLHLPIFPTPTPTIKISPHLHATFISPNSLLIIYLKFYCPITLFRPIAMLCGTDDILQNIISFSLNVRNNM